MSAIKLNIVIMVINSPVFGPFLIILASAALLILIYQFAANEFIELEKFYGIIIIINYNGLLILLHCNIDDDSFSTILASVALPLMNIFHFAASKSKNLMIYHILICNYSGLII